MHPDQRPPTADTLTTLAEGEIEIEGRLPWSSNGTFLVTVRRNGTEQRAVYKPHRGERHLWDFPEGLFLREVAAYEVSTALGWDIVPETILRTDAPLEAGSLQRFVDADFAQHYFTLLDDEQWHPQLRRMAVFDMVTNNADRKGGHCLIAEGRIWGIDNGLCFHVQPKLRTVIWDFGGEPIHDELRGDLARLAGEPPPSLEHLLSGPEIEVLSRRASIVSRLDCFPDPDEESRPYPWPLV